ncbi:MAG: hypothetical protein ACIAS6_13335 [Phycisphaerales bacterium JB060]
MGKAARKFQLGLLFLFFMPPLQALYYAVGAWDQGRPLLPPMGEATTIVPPIVLIPTITVLIGLAYMYDGWWNLRRLS